VSHASSSDAESRSDAANATSSTTLQGLIERVTYSDSASLYCVLRIVPEKGYETPPGSHLFRATRLTAVGKADSPTAGLRVRLTGHWTTHPAHGAQFEFEAFELLPPGDKSGLVKYLSSDKFRGIGEKLATRIVERLGDNAIDEILNHPEKLAGIRGLKPAVRDALVQSALLEHGVHRAHVFLRGLGLGPVHAAAVVRKLGPSAESLVRDDPFVLASGIPGIAFGTADHVATSLGLASDDPRRARAALVHTLKQASDEGHTLLPRARLIDEARQLFDDAISDERFESALDELARADAVVIDVIARNDKSADRAPDPLVYLPALARCEATLAQNLAHLLRSGPVSAWASARDLASAEARFRIELHPLQREAVLGLLRTPVGLLTGGPGVGKTTIVRMLVALAEAAHARVKLASPTGRAAKRLSEATGRDAETVHRMLGYEPAREGFLHDAHNPLEADLVVVDEISMLDVVLAHHLMKAIQPPTRVVFVGDPDQLPSVGPGNVLHDLITSGVVPVFRLSQIYRQAEGSLIVANAHRILAGEAPILPERGDRASDFYFFQAEDPEKCAERTIEVVTRRIPDTFGMNWIDDVQVIAPMYRGECGVDALNERLREANGRGRSVAREVRQGSRVWREGDRVIHTRNDYEKEVFNGDMGRIVRVSDEGGPSLVVKYPEREVTYAGTEIGDLQPAFAITVHRSQGGEFPAVVLPLVMQHYMMLQRHLLYTAITRAKKLVVLVGSPRALRMAIENAEQRERQSALAERLRRALHGGSANE
jgi:exodeoxyribonuclease V alpha subunit